MSTADGRKPFQRLTVSRCRFTRVRGSVAYDPSMPRHGEVKKAVKTRILRFGFRPGRRR